MPAMDHLKPRFNARLLGEARRESPVVLDDDQRRIAANWAASALLGQKEEPLQGQFLSEVFDRLLGYRQIVSAAGTHYMEPETGSKSVKGYRPPDARLGWFGTTLDRTRGVLELKAPGADLDAKQGSNYGKLTPVEQAFGYANKVDGCRWVVVSNFIEIRLYRTDRGQGYCQRFTLEELADPDRLAAFVFLMHRSTLMGPDPRVQSPVERLAEHTHVQQERITKAFYIFYRDLRLDLFHQLRADNPPVSAEAKEAHEVRLLELAQKLLDRCLFICFCEDTGLLPAKVLTKALAAKTQGFVPVSRWQQLCGLFAAVDKGHPPMQINGYNGGLFATAPALDALIVADASLDGIRTLADYDLESDLNVNILGHIFEQSIADLEAIRAEIRGEVADKQGSRRKRNGIFYTPDRITRFIVARTIGGWLAERYAEIEARHRTGKPGPLAKETRLKVWYDSMDNYVHEHGYPVPWSRYGAAPWSLEPPAVDALMGKIRERGVALAEFVGASPHTGSRLG
ncbi:type IIL restriction-modification enzyme MmeI [uncultured Thiodictyon sp.]|uniref:type IIL restriction-modification enzyme MmeI n=1 Tax=uncultured Thiodictyon sp. TaxID=1846217 RepID=UPI0025D4878F|nr:type IIL restriction-modification enzyme MmeI [uncultured Thiodictyon sp.]